VRAASAGGDRLGAYGLCVHGVDVSPSELVQAPAHWPALELRVRVTATPRPELDYVDGDRASLVLRSGGSVVVDRTADLATFMLTARPSPSALVHPYLAAVAAVRAHWSGRDSFHAGGFVAGGGVWGLLGDKGAGKSSTLAAMSRAGVAVISDDVLILDGDNAFAGPRSIDLRGDAAQRLGIGRPLGVIGQRERWRLPLPTVDPELPFRGWVTLRWGPKVVVDQVRGSNRLRELLRHRALRVPPPVPAALVELARRPLLALTRPRGWSSLDGALERLLDATSG